MRKELRENKSQVGQIGCPLFEIEYQVTTKLVSEQNLQRMEFVIGISGRGYSRKADQQMQRPGLWLRNCVGTWLARGVMVWWGRGWNVEEGIRSGGDTQCQVISVSMDLWLRLWVTGTIRRLGMRQWHGQMSRIPNCVIPLLCNWSHLDSLQTP